MDYLPDYKCPAVCKNKKQYLDANLSYLIVDEDFPAEIPLITESEYEAILAERAAGVGSALENRLYNVYSISGEFKGLLNQDQLDLLDPGIYIIDNRKVVK